MSATTNAPLRCVLPPSTPPGMVDALVWVADADAGLTVSDATTALPLPWHCAGVGHVAAVGLADTGELRLVAGDDGALFARYPITVGQQVSLVLDVIEGGGHVRWWIPRAERCAVTGRFVPQLNDAGVRAYRFDGPTP